MGPSVEINVRFLITCLNILLLWLLGLETPVRLMTKFSPPTHPSVQNITQKMTGYQGFQFQNLQSFEVEKALQNPNVRKSTGCDGIPSVALKLGATELTNPLTSLFNSCITLGEWPLGWKRGEWTPFF